MRRGSEFAAAWTIVATLILLLASFAIGLEIGRLLGTVLR
jgi:hypothetical protein